MPASSKRPKPQRPPFRLRIHLRPEDVGQASTSPGSADTASTGRASTPRASASSAFTNRASTSRSTSYASMRPASMNCSTTSPPPTSRSSRSRASKSGASTCTSQSKPQNWRDKMKMDNPQKYEIVKKNAKEYGTYYRLSCSAAATRLNSRHLTDEASEEALVWQTRHEKNNEGARKRMNKMNQRKRQEKLMTKDSKKSTPQTRHQCDKKRKQARLRKQRQRAQQTPQQKKAILAKRRMKYEEKRKTLADIALEAERLKLQQMEEQLIEVRRQLAAKEIHLGQQQVETENRNEELPGDEGLDMRTPVARKSALHRARKALPRRKSHCISTSLDIINKATPTKVAAFKRAGVTAKNDLQEAIVDAVTEGLKSPPHSAKRKCLASTLTTSLKKHGMQRAASRKFAVSRNLLSKAVKRCSGRKPVSARTVKLIQSFYEDNSNQLPDKKFVSKKTFKPRHVMESTIGDLHKKYNATNPEDKVSSTVFYQHRPKHVKSKSEAKYFGCLCEYCENIQLKINAVNGAHPATFKDIYAFSASTLCQRSEGSDFHLPDCISRQCSKCGVEMLDNCLEEFLTNPNQVQWKRWEMTTSTCHTKKGTKEVKKRALLFKEGTTADMIEELKAEAAPFAEHLFCKEWQDQQQDILRSKIKHGEVLGIFDFAENFKCEYQREVQSAYYSHDSATVHPVVVYYRCQDCPTLITESCVMVSDDLTHDYHLVNTFQRVVTDHLTSTRGLTLTRFYRYSDGCSCQYKSKGPISDIGYAIDDYKFPIVHNYSGTRHGKGASDGESGVVKRHASVAIKSGAAVINTPRALYDYLEANLTKSNKEGSCCSAFYRTIFYVHAKDVNRERLDRAVRTVPGTRKLHSIKSVRSGVVATRNLSCFCNPCMSGSGADCENDVYVQPWKEVRLHDVLSAQVTTLEGPTSLDNDNPASPSVDPAGTVGSIDPGNIDPASPPVYPAGTVGSIDPGNIDPAPLPVDPAGTLGNIGPASPSVVPAGTVGSIDPASPTVDPVGNIDPASPSADTAGTQDNTNPAPVAADPASEIQLNGYVAVKFNGRGLNKVYMAMVTRIDGDRVQLKFMRRNQDGTYIFPSEPEATHPMADIIAILEEPEMALVGRAFVYKFRKIPALHGEGIQLC